VDGNRNREIGQNDTEMKQLELGDQLISTRSAPTRAPTQKLFFGLILISGLPKNLPLLSRLSPFAQAVIGLMAYLWA